MLRNRLFAPVALLLFLAPFYLHWMAPSVSVGDSGEFITAAQTLSNPHAPSYPLFSLLGKSALQLVPFAHIAYRVNLVSLGFGLFTAVLLFLLLGTLGLSFWARLLASLTFAFSGVLREPSLNTEVFSLNAFFVVLLLLAALKAGSASAALSLCAFLLGLGMGNHHTLVLLLPGLLLLLWVRLKEERGESLPPGGSFKEAAIHLPWALLFFLLGFSVYIYLPVRSLKNPPLDWSNPETLSNFIRVITRADYGSLSLTLGEKLERNLVTALEQAARFFAYFRRDWSPAGLLLGLFGFCVWLKRDPRRGGAFLVLFLVSGVGFLLLGNLPFDAQSEGVLPRFFLMPAVPFACAMAFGLDWLLGRSRWFLLAACLLPLFLLARNEGTASFSRQDFAAYDYGRNLLRTLPPESALFMDGGDDTFYTLAYFNLAEGRRRDLRIHDRGGLIFKNPYGDDFRRIPREEKEARRQSVERSFLGMRPLYYSTFNRNVLAGAALAQRGILYEALPPGAKSVGNAVLWRIYSYRGIYEENDQRPYRLRALVPLYPFLRALEAGSTLSDFRYAAHYGTDIPWLRSNLIWELLVRGYSESNAGNLGKAESFYRTVLELDPKNASACSNLGVLAEKENKLKEAEELYKRAMEIDPSYADAHYNLGVLYWRQKRWADVERCFLETLRLKPDHPTAGRFLALLKAQMEKR